MDTEFQVQMRQSDKCGSVRNDEILNLHLGSGAGLWVSIPCLLLLAKVSAFKLNNKQLLISTCTLCYKHNIYKHVLVEVHLNITVS